MPPPSTVVRVTHMLVEAVLITTHSEPWGSAKCRVEYAGSMVRVKIYVQAPLSHTLLFFLLMTSGFFYLRRYVLITYHLYARFLTYVWRYFVSDRRWFGCYFALDKHWWFPQGSFLNTVVKTPARTQLVSGRGLVDRFIDTSRNWDVCYGCVGAVSLGCRGLLPLGRIWGNNSSIHLTSRGLQCLHLSGRTTFAMIYVCPRYIYVLWLLWELRAVPVSRW